MFRTDAERRAIDSPPPGKPAADGTSGTAGWVTLQDRSVYAVVHEPPALRRRNTAVLLLPPFGWDEVCSYRARRQWAIDLARAGFVTVRVDLPGTGESQGDFREPELTDLQCRSVREAVAWLRTASGCDRVAVIGIGFGGMLAVQALADGAEINDLILWSVPAEGRALIRELQAYHRIASAVYHEDDLRQTPDDDHVAYTGFAMTGETKARLRALRLDRLEFPGHSGTSTLMIGRGGRGVGIHAGLMEALRAAGITVDIDAGSDYPALISSPVLPVMPRITPAKSIRWLEQRSTVAPVAAHVEGGGDRATAAGLSPVSGVSSTAIFPHPLGPIRESVLSYPGAAGRIVGVHTRAVGAEPAPFCILMLNGGPTRRIGPNRLWVEMSRRWAARGVPVVRMDLEGMGDSDGDGLVYGDAEHLHAPALSEQARQLMDLLQADGIADRFVYVGLCSSAYWGWHATIADERVVALWSLNQVSVKWTRRLEAERNRAHTKRVLGSGLRERMARGPFAGFSRQDLLRGVRAFRPSFGWLAGSEELSQGTLIRSTLDALRERGTAVVMIFGQDEPMYEQLRRLGLLEQMEAWPNVRLLQLPSRDHNVRALWLQALVQEHLDAALDELLLSGTGVEMPRPLMTESRAVASPGPSGG